MKPKNQTRKASVAPAMTRALASLKAAPGAFRTWNRRMAPARNSRPVRASAAMISA
jgi:hypothetical protein